MKTACIRMNETCHTLGGSRFMFDEATLSVYSVIQLYAYSVIQLYVCD